MCRSSDAFFYRSERDFLKIRAFYLRLSISNAQTPLPESLTLLYLPRIDGSSLEINDSKIRPDAAAFVSLHRLISTDGSKNGHIEEAVFASRERVRVSQGIQFEVYMREDKVLMGIFRKYDEGEWKMECKCVMECECVGFQVSEAEVCVALDGQVAMNEKVKMGVRSKKKARGFRGLEEIPEEREVMDGYCYRGCFCEYEEEQQQPETESSGEHHNEEDGSEEEMEMELGGVRWAVDLGIWVMCLGVGYLVSKASSRSLLNLRRGRIL
ncbi:PREDICTED: uncharacterized protein LOC104593967 [Nelumbo nucifera]|uniref:Uncharacterized protein LOC104593967 n=1 Tax=Nelumbo nucifera TaxID=4432 RepID=A0A1U7ZVA8_NELNU|nr:PREDICTED: uncharacterized protein LOC104593967 [Nelumbo nucifera]